MEILECLSDTNTYPDVYLKHFALNSAGFGYNDLLNLYNQSCINSVERIMKKYEQNFKNVLQSVSEAGIMVDHSDLEKSLDTCRKNQSDMIGAPKIPNVQWLH